jgi:hypothetical protein
MIVWNSRSEFMMLAPDAGPATRHMARSGIENLSIKVTKLVRSAATGNIDTTRATPARNHHRHGFLERRGGRSAERKPMAQYLPSCARLIYSFALSQWGSRRRNG